MKTNHKNLGHSTAVSIATGVFVASNLKHVPEHASAGVDIPLGVLAVNSGSKQKVSSGLPAAGLNGGWSSLLYSFCRKHRILEINPYRGLFGVCELM